MTTAGSPNLPPSLQIPLGRDLRPLSDDDYDRHRRSLLVEGYGIEGQRRLAAARVLVVGAGGLGSPVLFYLAALGVGTIYVSDADDVERSNLQRQFIHTEATIGTPKNASAAAAFGFRMLAWKLQWRVPQPMRQWSYRDTGQRVKKKLPSVFRKPD